MQRSLQVLSLMYELTKANNGCISLGPGRAPVCITLDEFTSATQYLQDYGFKPPENTIPYPHWVMYIRSLLEEKYDADTIYRAGMNVYTTLDPDLQSLAQQTVTQQVRTWLPRTSPMAPWLPSALDRGDPRDGGLSRF